MQKDRDATDAQINAERLEQETAAAAKATTAMTKGPAELPEPQTPTIKPIAESDPLLDAICARFTEFEEADDESCEGVYLRTLNEPELMDDESAFTMLERIYAISIRTGKRARFAELIELFQERLPDIYDESRKYYLQWQILNALAMAQSERVVQLACQMAETAGDDVDCYSQVVNLLAYHGQLEALAKASRIAWPLIQSSNNILWGESRFAQWGVDCAVFEVLNNSATIDSRDPQLIEQVRFYFENLDLPQFDKYVDRLSGRTHRTWSLDELNLKQKKNRGRSSARQSGQELLAELTDEFVGYAHREEGIPCTKAELARQTIVEYIVQRHSGQLVGKAKPIDSVVNEPSAMKPKHRLPDNIFCPSRETLAIFLSSLVRMFSMQYYELAAIFELMPAWIRFLETRGLIDSTRRELTLKEIAPLHAEFSLLFDNDPADPALTDHFRRWSDNANRPVSGSLAVGEATA